MDWTVDKIIMDALPSLMLYPITLTKQTLKTLKKCMKTCHTNTKEVQNTKKYYDT